MFADMMRWGTESGQSLTDERFFGGHHPMMWFAGGNIAAFWFVWILWVVTWVLFIIVLIVLARWLWKKGDKTK